jgi:Ca2+:H+ antiporter
MLKPRMEWLLVFVVASFALEVLTDSSTLIFLTSVVALIPLAGLIGQSTEELAIYAGPQIGGLLNATFGNVTELIVGIFLVFSGEIGVVKATLIGSVIGNLLLVLGMAFLIGGWSRIEQTFNRNSAGMHISSLMIAVMGLIIPALFQILSKTSPSETHAVSMSVSAVLIVIYSLSLVFSLRTHRSLFGSTADQGEPQWQLRTSVTVLAVATALVAFMSEFLVDALEPAVRSLGVSKIFVGLIIIPIVGNAAEHASAVWLAAKDKMDVAIEIAIGSSAQVALFVTPALVLISLLTMPHLDYVFTPLEIAAVGVSTVIAGFLALDGRSNWLAGAQLLAAYVILAVTFYFL